MKWPVWSAYNEGVPDNPPKHRKQPHEKQSTSKADNKHDELLRRFKARTTKAER